MKENRNATLLSLSIVIVVCLLILAVPYTLLAAGGGGGGIPDTVEGPLNDKMSDQGKLFGDLYKILRYQGTEEYSDAVGGEPVLSEGYAQYAHEVDEGVYELREAPTPSQCVQPIADYAKWGELNTVTGLTFNRLPLVMTYDATWERTECEVGELLGTSINTSTGELTYDINPFFIAPNEECLEGILWTDLVDEVHFGRLNLSRSPEAVLLAAFDEAISAINSPDTVAITRDAAGRLLLEKNVYSQTEVDECGHPLFLGTTLKAIDSPLENLALYVKLIKDGHLVTPGDERAPIDRSVRGGIPLWKMLELSDGPSGDLRPTVDIAKLRAAGFGTLVNLDGTRTDYNTYYQCYDSQGAEVDCLCNGENHDGEPTVEACSDVTSRELIATTGECKYEAPDPNAATCEGPWDGIITDNGFSVRRNDFDFAAAFLAAAGDKTGEFGVDMVVYLNSILGINKVVGYSEYDTDGNPAPGAIDYSTSPEYFDFGLTRYFRNVTIRERGDEGFVTVLTGSSSDIGSQWTVRSVEMRKAISFRNKTAPVEYGFPENKSAHYNVLGFTQMADDDLSIIEFIHTYQIPGLR